jgi:hypothetical protein
MDILQSQSGNRVSAEARINVDPGNLLANTGVYQAVNWPANAPNLADVRPGKRVVMNPTADISTPGVTIGDVYVSALGVLRVQFINVTAGPLNAAAQDFDFVVLG